MAVNFYTREKEIHGKVYKAQFSGISAALEAAETSYIKNSDNISMKKYSDYIFKHIIVEPQGLTADDFDSLEEFHEVVEFGREVMQGKFRDTKNPPAAKKTSPRKLEPVETGTV